MNKEWGYKKLISYFEKEGFGTSSDFDDLSEQSFFKWMKVHQDVETSLYEKLAKQFSLPFKLVPARDVPADVPRLISDSSIQQYEALPLFKVDNCLTLGICNPFFLEEQKILQWKLHYEVDFCLLKKTNWDVLYNQLIVNHRYHVDDENDSSAFLAFLKNCHQREVDTCVFYFQPKGNDFFCFFGEDRYVLDKIDLSFPPFSKLQILGVLNKLFLLSMNEDVSEIVVVGDIFKVSICIRHFDESLMVQIHFVSHYEMSLEILKTHCTEKEVDVMLAHLDQKNLMRVYSSHHRLAWRSLTYCAYQFLSSYQRMLFEVGLEPRSIISSWYKQIFEGRFFFESRSFFQDLIGHHCFVRNSLEVYLRQDPFLMEAFSQLNGFIGRESSSLLQLLKECSPYLDQFSKGVSIAYLYHFRTLCEFCREKSSTQIAGMDLWKKKGCDKCFFMGENGKKFFLVNFILDESLYQHLFEFEDDQSLYVYLDKEGYVDVQNRLRLLISGKNVSLKQLEGLFPLDILEKGLS